MRSLTIFRKIHLAFQKKSQSLWYLRSFQFSSSAVEVKELPRQKNAPQTKLLKVAILGRPNAGKSTLINKLLKMNLCGVSQKTHTTIVPIRAAFNEGDTQIVFIDTPGIVTRKEQTRFNLPNDFFDFLDRRIIREADIIGVIHEVQKPSDLFRFHLSLTQNLHMLPASMPIFLVINKIDLIVDKEALQKKIDAVALPNELAEPNKKKPPRVWQRFSNIFFISAKKNIGVKEISDYLIQQAKPSDWVFQPGNVCDKPLNVVILGMVRSHLMDNLPNEVPYKCKYEIEYLRENEMGEIICVCLITCSPKHKALILSGRKGNLRSLSKVIENDLFKVIGKVFKIRIVIA